MENKKNRVWLSLLAALPLSGCMLMIDSHVRVPGWPELKIVEHHVSEAGLREQCARFAPPLTTPAACTQFHFALREAHIYVSKDFPSPRFLAHERLHAAGYDHPGSTSMAGLWRDWQAAHETGPQPRALARAPRE